MFTFTRPVSGLFAALGLLALAQMTAVAQDAAWAPDKPVEIVVPSAAGGGTDRTARQMQTIWQAMGVFEQPLVVVNKPGAGGAIGLNYIIGHSGDDHYVGVTQPSLVTNKILGTSPTDYNDVTPLATLANEYSGFAVRTDSDIKDAADLVAKLQADPTSVVFGVSSALGQVGHIGLAMVAQRAGVDITNLRIVVFPSGGESRTALLGGHIDLISSTWANLIEPMQAGQLRVIATTAPERVPGPFAEVPTWKENGIDVVIGTWRAVFGPPDMTPEQIAFWDKALAGLSENAEWQQSAEEDGAALEYRNSADTRAFMDAERDTLLKTLTELGLAQ